jgi:hypothetical protein
MVFVAAFLAGTSGVVIVEIKQISERNKAT